MTDAQRQHLEARLLEERARVTAVLDQYRSRSRDTAQDQSGDLSKRPVHLADEGTDTMDAELDALEGQRETRELGEIDDALRRLYEAPETFGVDEQTGREIAFARLEIVPWARTAVTPDR